MEEDWDDHGMDSDGDPIQSGLETFGHHGITRKPGPVLGVVLSVHAADDEHNLLLRTLRGSSGTVDKAAYAEADVLVLQSHREENFILPHCIIAQMKTSRVGPSEDEPSDYTEDLPNGCTAQELDALYSATNQGQVMSGADLSGDWVFVDFLGGVMQFPLIRGWFSNPHNFTDAAKSAEKKRFRFRRNNSGYTIEQNGDFNWYHRAGQFFQFKDNAITLKHAAGSVVHLDKDGSVNVTHKDGHTVRLDDEGILASAGGSSFEIQSMGAVNVVAPSADVTVAGENLNLIGAQVVASDGVDGGDSLAKDAIVSSVQMLIEIMQQMIPLLLATSPVAGAAAAVRLTAELAKIKAFPNLYMTSVLRGE